MSILDNLHPFFGNGVFSSDAVMKLIENGEIVWDDLEEEQIQPNTLDVRIGKTKIYSCRSHASNPDDIKPDVVYSGEKDEPIVIPSSSYAEIEIHDKIRFDPKKYMMDMELRSGRGRLQLLPKDNITLLDVNGKRCMGVFNLNPNDIILYGQDRFAQVFFNSSNGTSADGEIISDPEEVRDIAKACGVESLGPYLKFNSGDRVLKYRNIGQIDTRVKYGQKELFEEHFLPHRMRPFDPVLIQSKETISVPNDVGVRLLRRHPSAQRSYFVGPDSEFFEPFRFIVNSGWVDSGYEGKVTMQPFASLECVLGEVNPTCLGIVYRYKDKVSKPYAGHYQKQTKVLNS